MPRVRWSRLLLLFGSLLPAAGIAQMGPAAMQATFRASSQPIPTVEGGIVGWAGDLGDPWPEGIQKEVSAGYPLMRTHIDLGRFIDRPLSESFLRSLERGFAAVRRAGGKVIPRFTYNNPPTSYLGGFAGVADASLVQALQHIGQLKPILHANAEVIVFMEAGFVGAWGEWHSSASGLDSASNKRRIRDALLDAVPANRKVLFRYPADIRAWYAVPLAGPNTPEPGGIPSGQDRVGSHNDCMLSGSSDGGTFTVAGLRNYAQAMNAGAPYGGETCQFTPQRSTCADIRREGRALSLTYLNRFGTLDTFTRQWQKEGCLAEVTGSIGPRIQLAYIEHDAAAAPGGSVEVRLGLRNLGWSRLHNSRGFRVRLVHRVSGATIEPEIALVEPEPPRGAGALSTRRGGEAGVVDPRTWAPVETTNPPLVVRFRLLIPAGVLAAQGAARLAGEYRLALALPDASTSLRDDPRYAVRFANADDLSAGQQWDPATGSFFTGTSVTLHLNSP